MSNVCNVCNVCNVYNVYNVYNVCNVRLKALDAAEPPTPHSSPCDSSPVAGSDVNWIAKSDEEIVDASLGELARLFPTEIARDAAWPATAAQGPSGQAKLVKHAVVRVPRSVYAATPGRNKYRPSQESPISNFLLAGCFTSQKYLGSMEGAVLAGKLAAEVVADRAAGHQTQGLKPVQPAVHQAAAAAAPKEPVGVRGEYPIAFGGGQQGVGAQSSHP